MTLFRYWCHSKSGQAQVGFGETELELGSDEHVNRLLKVIAKTAYQDKMPWDPFNVKLTVVKAQIELKHL